jgi:dCTP deaminase
MILTDREIRIALREKQVTIDPEPDLSVAIASTTLDLTLSRTFKEWPGTKGIAFRPGADGYRYSEIAKLQIAAPDGPYNLRPGRFVLGWTAEKITLPYTSRLAARVEGKSSLARLGIIVHATAPVIHSGFRGPIQLELCNLGPNEVILDPGMYVCQLVFEITAGTPERGYSGVFQDQSSSS